MKTKPIRSILTRIGILSLISLSVFVSCSKDNEVTQLTLNKSTGNDIIDATIGGVNIPSSYTSGWYVDKSHSNVNWETKYYSTGAMLNGKFNMFNFKVYFDQTTPSNTTVFGWVQLSTFNTGEYGRDAYYIQPDKTPKIGCALTSMGCTFTTDTVALTVTPVPANDTAWFNSTACKAYGDGYVVTGDLKFRGVTKSVDMYMTYTGITTATNATSLKKTDRAGLYGSFKMKANSDFGVNSTSINDEVTVFVNCNLRSKEY